MKLFSLTVFVFFGFISSAQETAKNEYGTIPDQYNSFIEDATITWACEIRTKHQFPTLENLFNIHDYMIAAQLDGSIKSYRKATGYTFFSDSNNWDKKVIDDYFIEVHKEYNDRYKILPDSANLIGFQEILYYQNHKLISYVVTAAPMYNINSSTGRFLGNVAGSYSSLNLNPRSKLNKKDEILYLGQTYSISNFDSIEKSSGLKKSYGMTLSLLLWHDLSKGYNRVTDLKTNKYILPENIMIHSPIDSIDISLCCGDSLHFCHQKMAPPPAFEFLSTIGVYQKWFYNKTKDLFFSEIPKVVLYIKPPDKEGEISLLPPEKRYEIIFK